MALGSILKGVGKAIFPPAIPGYLKGLKEFAFGTKGEAKQTNALSGEQSQFLNQLLGQISPEQFQLQGNPLYQSGQSYLNRLLSNDPEIMKSFEQPALRQYNEQIVPALAERFTGIGAQNSSSFQNALAQSGKDLALDLQGLRSGLQFQALPQAFQYASAPSELGLQLGRLGLGTQAVQNYFQEGQPGFVQQILAALGGGVAKRAGATFGAGAGTAAANKFFPKTFGALSPSSSAFAPQG